MNRVEDSSGEVQSWYSIWQVCIVQCRKKGQFSIVFALLGLAVDEAVLPKMLLLADYFNNPLLTKCCKYSPLRRIISKKL